MTTTHIHRTLFLMAGLLTSPLTADTIELKSGVKYQGKVISEDEKSYLVEIHHSASIKDERRISKDQVRKIVSEASDTKEFKAIKDLVPTPDSLTEKDYLERIKMTSDFIKKHPKSKLTKKANPILKTLTQEKQAIVNGGIKLNGKIIAASDLKTNAYDIDASLLAQKVKKLAKGRKLQPALRQWEKLEQNYPYSTAYKNTLPFIPRVLKVYKAELQKNLDSLDAQINKREKIMESLSNSDRSRTEKALETKQKKYANLIAKEEKELNTKWLTIDPFSRTALEFNLRSIESAQQEISSTQASQIKLAGDDLRAAWTSLENGDLEGAETRLQALSSLNIPAKYTAPISQQLAEKQASAKKAEEEAAAAAKADEEEEKADEKAPTGKKDEKK